MSRKHFESVAAEIKKTYNFITPDCPESAAKRFGVLYAAIAVADALQAANPRFDRNRFLAACGVTGGAK